MTDTLIVIGAGNNPDPYLQEGYERIILVEPHPRLAESLRQKAAGGARVEELAIVTSPELNQLHEFNLQEASSTRQPTGLKQLLAGLRLKASYQVATLSPVELCQRYELPEQGRHKLVIQGNGEEVNIALSLLESGDLTRFHQIILAARRTAYYEGEKTIDAVIGRARELGFEIERVQQADLDWPVWKFEINPLQKTVETLQEENAAIKKKLSEQEDLVEEYKKWTDGLKSDVEKLNSQLESKSQSVEEQQRLAAMQAKLNVKLQADLAQLRKRYEEKVNSEQELRGLIKELHDKLQLAAVFYRRIEAEHPELLESD